jgi:hypothetical protein
MAEAATDGAAVGRRDGIVVCLTEERYAPRVVRPDPLVAVLRFPVLCAVAAASVLVASGCQHPASGNAEGPSGYGLMAVVPGRCVTDSCDHCDIEALSRKAAGPGARNCGWSRSDAERPALLRCAFEVEAKGGPFLAIESLAGIDSFIVQAFVRGADGRLVMLWYDSDGSGANCPCSAFVYSKECKSPLRTHPDEPDMLICDTDAGVDGPLLCNEKAMRRDAGT